jgi:hypothetical protein
MRWTLFEVAMISSIASGSLGDRYALSLVQLSEILDDVSEKTTNYAPWPVAMRVGRSMMRRCIVDT